MKKFKDAKNRVLPFVKENNLSPVILGVLIVIAGFAVFNIFDKFAPGEIETQEEETTSDTNTIEDTKLVEEKTKTINTQTDSTKNISEGIVATNTEWIANDYKKGDITNDKYTVVKGDTLWEIAEASYGNGAEWHKIADANNVTYLANGNPLIVPEQELTIPE